MAKKNKKKKVGKSKPFLLLLDSKDYERRDETESVEEINHPEKPILAFSAVFYIFISPVSASTHEGD